MRAFYNDWWAELEPTFSQTTEIYLGHQEHPRVSLTSHDWIQEQNPPWNQGHIRKGSGAQGGKHRGHWAVKVLKTGKYSFEMRRWPAEANIPINAGVPALPNVPGSSKAFSTIPGKSFDFEKVTLRIDGKDIASAPVGDSESHVKLTATLTAGSHRLSPFFTASTGDQLGAYYLIVEPAP